MIKSVQIAVALLATVLISAVGCTRNPEVAKRRYFESGQQYMKKGSYPEATVEFRKALQVDARYKEAYVQLGMAYLKQRRWPEAFASLDQALELDPNDFEAHFHLGNLELRAGDFDGARKDANIILVHQPDSSRAYQLLAASYLGDHQKEKARHVHGLAPLSRRLTLTDDRRLRLENGNGTPDPVHLHRAPLSGT